MTIESTIRICIIDYFHPVCDNFQGTSINKSISKNPSPILVIIEYDNNLCIFVSGELNQFFCRSGE